MDNRVNPDPEQRESAKTGWLEFQRKNTDIEGQKKNYLKLFFRFLIISCVVSDSIIAVLQTITFISQIFLMVFVLETLVRWYNGFKMFWRSSWNIMNLLITLTLFVGHRVTSDPITFIVFRCLRLIRLTLCLCSMQEMDMTLKATLQSFSEMKIIIFISVVAILAFTVAGVDMFSTTLPSAFENLSLTFYTLFVCITQDSWMDTYKILQEDEMGNTFWTLLYFSTFILSSGLMLSIFDAWIQGNFIVAQKEQADQERLTVNALFKDSPLDAKLEAADMIHVEVVVKKISKIKHQKPLRSGYTENLTVENYENLVIIMLAIQRNMDEYFTIKRELQKATVEEIKQHDQEITQHKETASLENMVNNEMSTGDIISTIINLSNAHLLDTSTDSPHLNKTKILKAGEQAT
ncbi:cation channel sperm-associated protein 4-like isoform X2 [Carassius carassius]|uniref:cation channel sperm-associated protein 4-like isoform X2 n=1 Tax=Carassius carassius TaxID=217509 RepID=UPI002868F4BF|nr:cation channel sperm-associated protein 4-like isoform X2 [Carassius carassius]